MYQLLRKFLFLFDAEKVHYFSMNALSLLCSSRFVRHWISGIFTVSNPKLQVSQFGLGFRNPVGLGAGFDKNARYLRELETLGFGFVEIGTVTPLPQAGNERPRLFRLPDDKALINRMGFNNDGVKSVVERLKAWKMQGWQKKETHRLIIGGNIGKNKVTPNEDAWKDYEICFLALFDYVDYFVVNVSSPNTPGLRELQEKDALRKILSHLQALNLAKSFKKPLLLKIAPDLTFAQLDDIIGLAAELHLDGLVVSNTTISREDLSNESRKKCDSIGAGGLSGKPLLHRSNEIVKYIHEKSGGTIQIIGSGGIFTADDAKTKLDSGASLIQVWTGFIYEGPATAKKICNGLLRKYPEY